MTHSRNAVTFTITKRLVLWTAAATAALAVLRIVTRAADQDAPALAAAILAEDLAPPVGA